MGEGEGGCHVCSRGRAPAAEPDPVGRLIPS
uniref:Uncharacterized protein n=1 Tax=Tetraselmis sp. GSL018 TaxID=582737 RepID=A0A061SJH5_9CHLO